MSSRQHEHLNDLSQLRYLVIDEADRMIQQGSFPQLERILDAVHTANPLDSDDEEEDDGSDDEDPDRMLSLPGIPGEARVQMLDDVLKKLEEQKGRVAPESAELDDSEYEEEMKELDEDDDDEEAGIELPSAPPVYRQTFVFSATLTLPPSDSYRKKKRANKGKRQNQSESLTGAIAEILEKAHAHGQTKVVDLTSSNKLFAKDNGSIVAKEGMNASKTRLPPGLSLHSIACTQKHKDSHLYAYLVTTEQGAKGPCLVFCNSIAAVKRVGTTLLTLKLPVRMLHASMPQVRTHETLH
jgi:ATP-dependent RNA helicase DDX24/MAK5